MEDSLLLFNIRLPKRELPESLPELLIEMEKQSEPAVQIPQIIHVCISLNSLLKCQLFSKACHHHSV